MLMVLMPDSNKARRTVGVTWLPSVYEQHVETVFCLPDTYGQCHDLVCNSAEELRGASWCPASFAL
jgi:hypothetical protein